MKKIETNKMWFAYLLPIIIFLVIGSCKKDKFIHKDSACPQVVSTSPLSNAVNVPTNQLVTATFNEIMDTNTITTSTFIVSGSVIPGSVTYSGYTATFTPTDSLKNNHLYTARVTTSVRDLLGNTMQREYVWTFTTGKISNIVPIVVSTNPQNKDTGVALNKVIIATFNTAMDSTTFSALSYTVKEGVNLVAGSIVYSSNSVSFTPNSQLLPNTNYVATIYKSVKSAAGINMDSDYVWTFKTLTKFGPQPPDLKGVERFGIISGVGVRNNAGASVINNLDVGIYPGARSSIVGFPPATIVNGNLYAADDAAPIPAMLLQAKNDLTAAYLYAEGAISPAPTTVSGDQGGKTLAPGIYKSTSTLLIQNGDLTLDAQGNPNAFWIFQIASDFTTIGGSPYPSPAGGNVILTGGAQAKNVFWQVGSSATLGDYTSFKGNILALTSVTMNAYARADGRMLCRNGSVVLTSTNIINKP